MSKATSVERFTRRGTLEYLSTIIENLNDKIKLLPGRSREKRLAQEQAMFIAATIDFISNADLEETYVQSTFTQ